MEDAALTLILLLGPCLTHACTVESVAQSPQVLATLIGHEVNITCEVKLTGEAPVSHHLYKNNVLLDAKTEIKNRTATHRHQVSGPLGVYYCRAACGGSQKQGQGTYIYVKGSGYSAPSSSSHQLCAALIVLLLLLLLLAGFGTYLMLPFVLRREEVSPPHPRGQSSAVKESLSSPPVVKDAGSSLYTSLEPRSEEVYDILEDEAKTKQVGSPKKHQVEVHDVAPRSPVKKLQKPKEKVSESNVYENFKR